MSPPVLGGVELADVLEWNQTLVFVPDLVRNRCGSCTARHEVVGSGVLTVQPVADRAGSDLW